MSERRNQPRRAEVPKVEEPLERKEARRGDERRDSPRVPMTFLLRDVTEGGSYVEREGDLSIGGIYWKGKYPPQGKDVEVRFRLRGVPKEIRAMGEIIRVTDGGKGIDFNVRFTELAVQDELAIAKHIDDLLLGFEG